MIPTDEIVKIDRFERKKGEEVSINENILVKTQNNLKRCLLSRQKIEKKIVSLKRKNKETIPSEKKNLKQTYQKRN